MKKLILAGVTLVSVAAFAPANAQQAGSATQQTAKPQAAAQQSSNRQSSNISGQQANNAAQPSRDEIKQAQQVLDQKGFHVNADGVLGPQTKQALNKFQQQQKLQQTGQLDQQTMEALGMSQTGSTTGQGGSSNNGATTQPSQPSSGMKK